MKVLSIVALLAMITTNAFAAEECEGMSIYAYVYVLERYIAEVNHHGARVVTIPITMTGVAELLSC
jgi:hypothetical protein